MLQVKQVVPRYGGWDKLNKARDVFDTHFADKAVFDKSSTVKIGASAGDEDFVETSGYSGYWTSGY